MIYHFPFSVIAKERERARAIKRGAKWSATVYSPASTKEEFKRIREYLMTHYPDYETHQFKTPIQAEVVIGITEKNRKSDLDNHFKMLFDALNPDKSRKNNSGFKGVYKDDKLLVSIIGRFDFVERPEDEYTDLTISPYTPFKGG